MTPGADDALAPEEVGAFLDDALAGGYGGKARLVTQVATSRSADPERFDDLLDGVATRAAKGDEDALEILLHLVRGLHLADGSIRSRTSDAALADDAAQQTLIAVEHRISSYGGLARFRTWLYAVARNETLMLVRRRSPEPVAEPAPAAAGRFTSAIANKLSISDIIDRLPDPYRETLRLQIFEDLDYEGIAARLGIPVGTVRSRLAKAKELMRELLTELPL